MDDAQGGAPAAPSNLTRANIVGKVPKLSRRGVRRKKLGKMPSDKRKHVGQLQKAGVISASAAAKSGLK